MTKLQGRPFCRTSHHDMRRSSSEDCQAHSASASFLQLWEVQWYHLHPFTVVSDGTAAPRCSEMRGPQLHQPHRTWGRKRAIEPLKPLSLLQENATKRDGHEQRRNETRQWNPFGPPWTRTDGDVQRNSHRDRRAPRNTHHPASTPKEYHLDHNLSGCRSSSGSRCPGRWRFESPTVVRPPVATQM